MELVALRKKIVELRGKLIEEEVNVSSVGEKTRNIDDYMHADKNDQRSPMGAKRQTASSLYIPVLNADSSAIELTICGGFVRWHMFGLLNEIDLDNCSCHGDLIVLIVSEGG